MIRLFGSSAFRSGPSALYSIRLYSSKEAKDFIEKVIKENDVVVFMKGTANAPMCGFSKFACAILQHHGLPHFTTVNVLEEEDIRQGVKDYTNWPTIPQIFVRGNFLGGADILRDMHQSGELKELLVSEKLVEPEGKYDDTPAE